MVASSRTLECGILSRPLPFIEVNSFSPPLMMTKAEAEEAVARFGKALDLATPELERLAMIE